MNITSSAPAAAAQRSDSETRALRLERRELARDRRARRGRAGTRRAGGPGRRCNSLGIGPSPPPCPSSIDGNRTQIIHWPPTRMAGVRVREPRAAAAQRAGGAPSGFRAVGPRGPAAGRARGSRRNSDDAPRLRLPASSCREGAIFQRRICSAHRAHSIHCRGGRPRNRSGGGRPRDLGPAHASPTRMEVFASRPVTARPPRPGGLQDPRPRRRRVARVGATATAGSVAA